MARRLFGGAILLCLLAAGCQANAASRPATPAGSPNPPASETLRRAVEAQHLPRMGAEIADTIRRQPWLDELTDAKVALIAAVQKTEQAARARGEQASVLAMLRFATTRAWYADGLDDTEAAGLAGVFAAYAESLTDDWAPAVGPVLDSTLEYRLFALVPLAGSERTIAVLASAEDPAAGRLALALAEEALRHVQAATGPYPYPFLHLDITDLGGLYAGLSYEAFIALDPEYVDVETVVHEITHSTVYGLFPLWFEEGLAHYMEYYLTGTLEEGAADFRAYLRSIGLDERLDLRPNGYRSLRSELVERAEGFLLLKDIFAVVGEEGFARTLSALRTKTLSDQELLRAIVQQAPSEEARKGLRSLFCRRLVGSIHDYCS